MERNFCLNWPDLVKEAVKRRKQQGLTQNQMCAIAGVSKPTLVAFEKGKTTLKLDTCLAILDVLGMVER